MDTVQIVSLAASTLVGTVFLLTGGAKMAAPNHVFRPLGDLGVPFGWQSPVAWIIATGECVPGVALVCRIAPAVVFPSTAALLVLFSILVYWSTSTRRVPDCGCYGGAIQVSPVQYEREKLTLGVGSLVDLIAVEDRLTDMLLARVDADLEYAVALATLWRTAGYALDGDLRAPSISSQAFVAVPAPHRAALPPP